MLHMAKTWGTRLAATIITTAAVAGIPLTASAQAAQGPEQFTVIVNGNSPQLFIAHGTIHAAGTAVPVSGNNNGGTDEVRLPGGTFMLTLQNNPASGGHDNPVTCIDTFYGAGTSAISDGTGRFAGIAGNGTYTYHGAFIATRTPQGCSQQGTVIDRVQDHGTVTLG
jgi:hypothetical protein